MLLLNSHGLLPPFSSWFSLSLSSSLSFCPTIVWSALLVRQRINGKTLESCDLSHVIIDICITVPCPDWNKIWGQWTWDLNNTRITFTQCTKRSDLQRSALLTTVPVRIRDSSSVLMTTQPAHLMLQMVKVVIHTPTHTISQQECQDQLSHAFALGCLTHAPGQPYYVNELPLI